MNEQIKKDSVECARGIADWLCIVQYPSSQSDARSGTYPYVITPEGNEWQANNWNNAFAIMGLLAAYKALGEVRYEQAALNMGRYLKSLQIFDPFNSKHYGAIREITPQTPWCFTRDALSAAWAFIELYRHTDEQEYLERATLWAEWFLKQGIDDDGWPLWGIQFEPYFGSTAPQMRNDIQGSFQGGGLNFFYQLAQATGDGKWTGQLFVKMADFFIDHIQQPSGMFVSIEQSTKQPPASDPQNGLHRANDDLGTLGLLCAYRVTGDERYLRAIEKFLNAVFAAQDEKGNFEDSVAGTPVILNILHEAGDLLNVPLATTENIERAQRALFARQDDGLYNNRRRGGIIEKTDDNMVCSRSGCYALIYLLKQGAGIADYLKS
jgi:rhamnogalacturonyl hydrolase YesR